MAQANAQAEEVLRIAKDDGHKEGYDEGFRQAKEELEQEYGRRKEELEQLRESLKEEHEKEMQELEPKLLDVILDVVEKVFHIQFNDKRDILLHLISGTIAEIEGSGSFWKTIEVRYWIELGRIPKSKSFQTHHWKETSASLRRRRACLTAALGCSLKI